jgi:hypothetical protein
VRTVSVSLTNSGDQTAQNVMIDVNGQVANADVAVSSTVTRTFQVATSVIVYVKVQFGSQHLLDNTNNPIAACAIPTPTPTPSPTPSPSPTPTPTPKPPTLTVSCLTNHDVFSGGQIDLEIKAVYSNGTQPTLSPADVQIWADEGSMMDGTKHTYTDSSGTYWVQRWQGPITTITHTVKWHAMVKGATNTCDGVNNEDQ